MKNDKKRNGSGISELPYTLLFFKSIAFSFMAQVYGIYFMPGQHIILCIRLSVPL
jgi:hypothetical protein